MKYPINTYTQPERCENGYFFRLHSQMRYIGPISRAAKIKRIGALVVRVLSDVRNLFLTLVRERLAPMAGNVTSAVRESLTNQREVKYQVHSKMRIKNRNARLAHTVTRVTPIRPREIKSDILVPLQQTALSGVIAGVGVGLICVAVDRYWFSVLVTDMLFLGGVTGFGVFAVSWFRRVGSLDDSLHVIEQSPMIEQQAAEQQAQPQAEPQAAQVAPPRQITVNRGGKTSTLEVKNDLDKIDFETWRKLAAQFLQNGVKWSRPQMAPRGGKFGIIISQGEYNKANQAMKKENLISRGKPNDKGCEFLSQFLS